MLINHFFRSGITAVINLQETGEHASCGNALHSSGFSYDPIEFMDNEIYYYNFNIQVCASLTVLKMSSLKYRVLAYLDHQP